MKVGICTLGCKVNTYESEFIINEFIKRGYQIGNFKDICDIYIINTCTVTNTSSVKSRKMISQAYRNNSDACIVVCGCYVEGEKFEDFPHANILIGNYGKSKIVDLVEEYLKNKKTIIMKADMNKVMFEDMEIDNCYDHTRAFVKIEDGCENFCTYCIIPYVRGRCRSKGYNKVLEEIDTLVKNDYKEIVLTGIHTGNYGRDINTNFSTLLKDILKIKNIKRLRISSIEITELDDDFLDLLNNNVLCNHLHIPLQSGSDSVLQRMNRKYNKDDYLQIINKIRNVRKDIAITTDIIVGFPGESEEEFNECLSFAEQVGFSKIHVFPYSMRNNTKAATMKDQISEELKHSRVKKMLDLSRKLELKYKESFIGKEENVLIETVNDYSYGWTTNYLKLKLPLSYKQNEIYKIMISKDNLL